MSNAVETERLNYATGRGENAFRLTNLSMHVPRGAVYGFLGANGSGKTTTFRLLLALLKGDSGRITVLGESMPDRYVSVLAKTGYVPERPHVYPSLTVREAIDLHRAFYPTWDQKWSETLLKEFRLVSDRKQGSLSKGESGKLQMLLALSQRPELLILDEPTDGLDPVARRARAPDRAGARGARARRPGRRDGPAHRLRPAVAGRPRRPARRLRLARRARAGAAGLPARDPLGRGARGHDRGRRRAQRG